ncbi:isoleucyl-tRNA synthetase [Epithele typhae]|uniref:isoleucyl-tRNA synthetase n=1 Tax=Epithele typhae TaxID=378194 RepID=UPI0020088020|nr:isoleucyl-tRNA synthetase [Epithele typhae]KAH9941162.1 isoleucyl-tRNA synthetase [Epithele typhae]
MPPWSLVSAGTRFHHSLPWARRWLSSSLPLRQSQQAPAWGDSLLLPKTTFPLYNDPSKDPAIRTKTTEELYDWQRQHAQGPLFVFLDGPPYANGDLHMGHALNKILKDIQNRFRVLIGNKVYYHPGWDCHGLPIENKVLKQLGVEVNELTPLRIREEAEKYARNEVASQMKQFRELGIMANWNAETTYRTLDPDYELRQLNVFKAMVEKGLIYRQHRPVHYSPSSQSALAEAELVYNDAHFSHSVYVTFPLDLSSTDISQRLGILDADVHSVSLLVWTTTPWTLTANMAIAVNPGMRYRVASVASEAGQSFLVYALDRADALHAIPGLFPSPPTVLGEFDGSNLVGAQYRPIFAPLHSSSSSMASLPVIASSHVTPDSGTGLVHCAPAHGPEDYAAMQSLGLLSRSTSDVASNLVCHVNSLGQFTSDVAAVVGQEAACGLVAKDVLGDGSRGIVDLLRRAGAVLKVQRYKHRYPYDWKTDQPVITLATSQWFANLDVIKNDAVEAMKEVSFVPKISQNRLESFVQSRSEWCISRQRVWGVPIPALYHIPTNGAVLDSDSLTHILDVLRKHGPGYWWDGPVSAFVPPSRRDGKSDTELDTLWKKGTDTMDVWFDSGVAWSQLEDLIEYNTEGRAFGADAALEGTDQHRGWFQSLLLTALGSAQDLTRPRTAPYRTLVTHGMVLDEQGKKMSKSLGNIVSPMAIIHGDAATPSQGYGPDVLRLWAATVEFWKDMSIGPLVLEQCAETMRKVRNSARFMLGSLGDRPLEEAEKVPYENLGLAERYVLHRLHRLDGIARTAYEAYDYPRVMNELSYMANITLSSFYFHMNKDCLYADSKDSLSRRRVLTVLDQTLTTMTKVLAPALPHLAEEIHSTRHGPQCPSVFTTPWTTLPAEFENNEAQTDMDTLFRIRSKVHSLLENASKDGVVKRVLATDVIISISTASTPEIIDLLGREEHTLCALFGVSSVTLCDRAASDMVPEWEYKDTLDLSGTEVEVAIRPAAREKCPRCWMHTRPVGDELCKRCTDVVHV